MTSEMQKPEPISKDPLLPRDTRKSLPIALLRAREAVMRHFRAMLATHNITEQQWRTMRILAEHNSLEASELAERACILPPSLTRILLALEGRGLIYRKKDENDGRRAILEIAPDGIDLINKVGPDSMKIYQALEKRFGREMLDDLLDLLIQISTFDISDNDFEPKQ